jgi:hypothetical protein
VCDGCRWRHERFPSSEKDARSTHVSMAAAICVRSHRVTDQSVSRSTVQDQGASSELYRFAPWTITETDLRVPQQRHVCATKQAQPTLECYADWRLQGWREVSVVTSLLAVRAR